MSCDRRCFDNGVSGEMARQDCSSCPGRDSGLTTVIPIAVGKVVLNPDNKNTGDSLPVDFVPVPVSMVMTGKEIVDLARVAGLPVKYDMLEGDQLETEFKVVEHDGSKYAFYLEYPEEGSCKLG